MARNHKLTGVLRGRKLVHIQTLEGSLALGFDDGSTMTVRLGGPAPDAAKGAALAAVANAAQCGATNATTGAAAAGVVRAVRQRDVKLFLDLDDGTTLDLTTAEATSCVLVRDKKGDLEYAD